MPFGSGEIYVYIDIEYTDLAAGFSDQRADDADCR